jgi:hypothetical protein
MAPSRKRKRAVSRVRQNPVKSRSGLVPRIPRPRIKFDGHLLSGTATIGSSVTASNAAFDYHFVDCNITYGIPRAHNAITDSYQNYVYRSLRVEWLPIVGPAHVDAGAQVQITYIDNAEDMFFIQNTATATTAKNAILSTNYKAFNAWERFTWNVPLTRRRKTFAVNTVYTPSIESLERSAQGMMAMAISGTATAAIQLGSYRFIYDIELTGLSSYPGT